MTTSEPTTGNVIQQIEGHPTLLEAARTAHNAANAILNRVDPTTPEIVDAIRACKERYTCHGCVLFQCKSFKCDSAESIADRLELLEREKNEAYQKGYDDGYASCQLGNEPD